MRQHLQTLILQMLPPNHYSEKKQAVQDVSLFFRDFPCRLLFLFN